LNIDDRRAEHNNVSDGNRNNNDNSNNNSTGNPNNNGNPTANGNNRDDPTDNNNNNGRNPNGRDGNSSLKRDYYGQSYEASSRDHGYTGKGINLAKDKFIRTYESDTLKAIKAFETRAYYDKAIQRRTVSLTSVSLTPSIANTKANLPPSSYRYRLLIN